MSMDEVLIKAIAKKKGISEEEAQAYVEAFKDTHGEAEYAQLINLAGGIVEAVKDLPPQSQQSLLQLVGNQIMTSGNSNSDIESLAQKIAIIKTVLGGDDEKVKALEQKIDAILENKQNEQLQQIIQALTEQTSQQIEALKAELSELKGTKNRSAIDEIAEEVQDLEEKRKKLQELLGIREQREDTDTVITKLKAMGYKVEPPMSAEEFQKLLEERERHWQEKLEQEVKKTRELTAKEMELKIGREKMLTDFAANIIGSFFENITPTEKGSIANAIKKGLSALKGSQG